MNRNPASLVFLSLVFTAAAAFAANEPTPVCPLLPRTPQPLPQQLSSSTCANGDFENGLAQWFGQHGAVMTNGDPVFIENGLFPGELASCYAHQTIVERGIDPNAGISTVAPGRSTHAVRLGNAMWSARTESLGKTFVVEKAQRVISFSYALVFQNPDHEKQHQQPSFSVRVLNAQGQEITGVVDLGNGTNKLIAPGTKQPNPFFSDVPGLVPSTLYRDWTCAIIDLSGHVGETVTVLFETEDCSLGGHFTYAYIDDFCGGGQCGPTVTFDPRSDECGVGRICFRYTTASPNAPVPAVTLQLLQDDIVKATLNEPVVTNDTICFRIDPAKLTTLDHNRESFQWLATTQFAQFKGTYFFKCDEGCCPGRRNLLDTGDDAFDSDYRRVAPNGAGSVRPGEYAVVTSAEAASVAPTWNVCAQGRFVAVNGDTCDTRTSKVWSQTVDVVPGTTYRFCAKIAHLSQPAFDPDPVIELRFNPIATVVKTIDTADDCGWMRVDAEFVVPTDVASITAEIHLRNRDGDGNDIAIDEVSLQRQPPGDPTLAQFDLDTTDLGDGTYTVTATPRREQPYPFTWEVCEGEECSTGIAAPTGPFDATKAYRIIYAVDDPCAAVVRSTRELPPK